MADYNRNRDYSSGYNQDQYRDRENQYDRNAGYGNVNSNREEYRSGYTGNSGYGDARDYDRGYENRGGNRDLRNVSYGSVYHGNVERREQETNRASGGRYASGQGGYNRDQEYGDRRFGTAYGTSGNYYRNEDRDYDRTHYGRDRDWTDRAKDEVASWFGNEDAERRREWDDQHNRDESRNREWGDRRHTSANFKGKGPLGYSRSDVRILEDICDRLTDDSDIDATDVIVKVEQNEVVLSGTVHSREEKRRAEDVAERISGVRNVQNLIRVARDTDADRNRERDTSPDKTATDKTKERNP
ncbi:BON domain-containing protein [Paraflavisolibacter sp. H34]|uniref:BON domain-containing protein n=1 Tax=Huijunlia imazamoxiresistens TaxID=3127457 RepID=UPI00301823E5